VAARDNTGKTALDEALQKHNDSAVQKLQGIYASLGIQQHASTVGESIRETSSEGGRKINSDSDLLSQKIANCNVCEEAGRLLSRNPCTTCTWIDAENARMGAVFFRLSVN
jgi:hypothetical protein